MSFCQAISLMAAVQIGGLLYSLTQNFFALVILCGAFAAISMLILLTIPEVRVKSKSGHASPAMGEDSPMV
jgi:hypothetical protein